MAFPAKLGSLTDELIEALNPSTSQNDLASHDALKESSLRKLRQHSFLRTNQFEVYSALDGYEEKFRVLNRDGLADALRDRLDSLAQCSNRWTPDVLHLLLILADQPVQKTNLSHVELLNSPEQAAEPKLNWSDIAKEDGWEGEEELWQNVNFAQYSSDDDYIDQSDASAQSEATTSSVEARFHKQPTDYGERLQSQFGLDDIRKSQAWRRKRLSRHSDAGSQEITVTEIQAIREILFMLSGLKNGLTSDQGELPPEIQLSNVSRQLFKSILASANDAGCKVSHLRRYVKQQQEIPLLQVFQAAIEHRLESFDNTIASVQAHYVGIDQDVIASIMKLLDDLSPHIRPLRSLAGIIEELERCENAPVFHYLELLFDSAEALQLDGDEDSYHFISRLFFECFAVYLRPIRSWMQSGELTDRDKSFFISRTPVDTPRSKIWAAQFNMKRTSQDSIFAPRFLQPAASKIFTTGKSLVILKLLGKHWPIQEVPESATQLDAVEKSSLVPFSEVFRDMFDQWMQHRHHAASTILKQTLFETYSLWSDLNGLQYIYLMSNGSRSDQFASAVFSNIDVLNTNWHDRFNLTEIAREAFEDLVDPYRLNVNMSQNSAVPDVEEVRQKVRGGLPLIRITYRLPWVSQIVLADDSLEHYQSVFTFLLQLRRATNFLTKHRILSGSSSHMTAEQEIFYGLRSKLLWFCNILRSYMSNLVLGPLVNNFMEEMRQAQDIDQMLTVHGTFTKEMLDEACLGSKLEPIQQAILDIFDLAIRLHDAHQIKLDGLGDGIPNMRPGTGDGANRYIEIGEEEDETFLGEQNQRTVAQEAEIPRGRLLRDIRSDLDRHLKFICGGLRVVARASSSKAASKWDILAEMLEAGI
ncbi:Spc98 family-domain-containing protein [Nemania sp. FL0916]|nr:Spc98 family-domain-containing protein [Nemania sp. FL0916]